MVSLLKAFIVVIIIIIIIIQIRLDLERHLRIKISEKTQCFDVSMTSFSSIL